MANNFPNSKTVERLRKRYPEGCRVKLIQMDDIQAPPAGTCGTVSYVDDIGSIHVNWDTGSTLAVVYGVTSLIDTDELALVGSGNEVATIMGLTKAAALAYLMFNLYTPPCFAALGAMNSEMQSKKWLWGGICLQLGTGYTVAFFVYQIGTLITTGSLGTAFVPGLIAVAVLAVILIVIIRRSDHKFATEYSLHASAATQK